MIFFRADQALEYQPVVWILLTVHWTVEVVVAVVPSAFHMDADSSQFRCTTAVPLTSP